MNNIVTTAEILAYDPARSNLLAYSRKLDLAPWTVTGVTVSANSAITVDNELRADLLVENGALSEHRIDQIATATSNAAHCFSIYVQPGPRDVRLELIGANPANYLRADFNLTTGALTGTAMGGTASGVGAEIQKQGTYGWYRVRVFGTPQSAAGATLTARVLQVSAGATTYTGSGGSTNSYADALLETGTALGDAIETEATPGPGIKRLLFASAKFTSTPSSTPANVAFDNRIVAAPNFARRAFGNARITSGGQSTGGVLDLQNTDHAMAFLMDLGLSGRDITIRVADTVAGWAGFPDFPGDWTAWLTGTVEQVEVGLDRATLRLRDRMAVLDQPIQPTKYAGTNALPAGAEGVATDIKGQPKPLAWGRCYQVPGVLVNTSKLTYQVHDGQVQAIDAVYDKGAVLTFGANRANLAALEAAVIAGGSYDTCTALGLFRLGGSPAGRITADVRGDAAGSYVDRTGAIIRRILETKCGVATASIDTAAIAAVDAAVNYEAGIWIGAETTRRVAIEALQASIGAFTVPGRTGIWSLARLVAPSGTPAAAFTDADILDIAREGTSDPGAGVPVWQVTVRFKRYWTAFSATDLAAISGALTEAFRGELQQEWRTVTTTDAATQTTHLLASTLERDTLLTSATDAATERDRLLALHKVRRDYVKLRVALTDETALLDLGQVVSVTTPALGYSAGRSFVILGITREDGTIIFDLWG